MSSDGWKRVQLGDILTLHYGKALVSHQRTPGVIPVYSSSGISGWHDKPLVNDKGIIIGRKGNVGTVYYCDVPFYCIDTAYYVTPDDTEIDFLFLYYLLKTLGLNSLNEDSAVPGLNRETALAQWVNIPVEKQLQTKIADQIAAFDEKIELNRQTNATLEAIAQVIFKEWFVDFNYPGATGEMVESKLGPIPKGWRVRKLGEILDIHGGTTPSTKMKEFWNGEYLFVTPKDLSSLESPFLLTTERKITLKGVEQISSGILPTGTLLLSSRAPIGYLAITCVPVSINQGFIAINSKETSNLFIMLWLRNNMDLVISRANGSTFLEISKSNFRDIDILLPDISIVELFENQVSPFFEQIRMHETQITSLAIIRDSLLPKLLESTLEHKEFSDI